MKRVASFLFILSAVMLLVSCSSKNQENVTIRLNEVVHSIFYAPQYVALEKGFFLEEGLEVQLSVGQGADTYIT